MAPTLLAGLCCGAVCVQKSLCNNCSWLKGVLAVVTTTWSKALWVFKLIVNSSQHTRAGILIRLPGSQIAGMNSGSALSFSIGGINCSVQCSTGTQGWAADIWGAGRRKSSACQCQGKVIIENTSPKVWLGFLNSLFPLRDISGKAIDFYPQRIMEWPGWKGH